MEIICTNSLIVTTTGKGKFGTCFTEETMAQKNNLFKAANQW